MSREIKRVARPRQTAGTCRIRRSRRQWLVLAVIGALLTLVAVSSNGKVSAGSRAGTGSRQTFRTRANTPNPSPTPALNVIINEVDSDTPGVDDAEFIELYDGGVGNTSLNGLVLVLFDGSTNTSYNGFDLTGRTTDANGYFVLGSPVVSNVDFVVGFNFLQNGEDAVALYAGSLGDFPNGTNATTTNLLDAVVYDTSDPDDPELALLLNAGQPQVNEDATGNGDTQSIGRCPNGSGGQRNTSSYVQDVPSPDGPNNCPTAPPDSDADGVPDATDNCPFAANQDQADFDHDSIGDECDADDDNDGQSDLDEIACGSNPIDASNQADDSDSDTQPDCVDTDDDNDGVLDANDNCPLVTNVNQEDDDGDGLGNACDSNPNDGPTGDLDGDGVSNNADNCPTLANSNQADFDADGLGDACDPDDDNDGVIDANDLCANTPAGMQVNSGGCPDADGDGVADANDNCPTTTNADQADFDHDGIGDVCDPDDDNDGAPDASDNCPLIANSDQADTDRDGLGNACDPDDDNDGMPDATDNCSLTANSDQADNDRDGLGNACDPDDDNDGVADSSDNCPFIANPSQANNDHDGAGDVCDPDDDNDGVTDANDNCPLAANPDQADSDRDGVGNVCDNDGRKDSDHDGVPNASDNCPFTFNPRQVDSDHDGAGDACDPDNDNDGVRDNRDNCPFTANPNQSDRDHDGVGDVCDLDNDNDRVPDAIDNCPSTYNPKQLDTDHDGMGDACTPYKFPAGGAFVIGDKVNLTGGATVYFSGPEWAKSNPMSDGPGPISFKGFEGGNARPDCGETWHNNQGNSSNPPANVPQYMAVIVASSVEKKGSTVFGNIRKIVVIKTNPGYGTSPGQTGTGTIVAVICIGGSLNFDRHEGIDFWKFIECRKRPDWLRCLFN